MFNFFKKTEKLEFVSLLPEMTQLMPIEPSRQVSYNWLKEAMADYKKIKAQKEPLTERFTHFTRCPGMLSISKTGWVQRAWQDISIRTNGDGVSFEWTTPIDQNIIDADHNWKWPYVSHHPEDLYSQFNKLGNHTLKTVIKIQSPWVAYIPKGYYLMSMPIPYPDRHEFTPAIGLLDGDYGPNFLNVQMFWHELNGEVKIPAGTPLCQYMLIKKHDIKGIVREYNKKDIDNLRLRASTIDSKWQSNYTQLKKYKWKSDD